MNVDLERHTHRHRAGKHIKPQGLRQRLILLTWLQSRRVHMLCCSGTVVPPPQTLSVLPVVPLSSVPSSILFRSSVPFFEEGRGWGCCYFFPIFSRFVLNFEFFLILPYCRFTWVFLRWKKNTLGCRACVQAASVTEAAAKAAAEFEELDAMQTITIRGATGSAAGKVNGDEFGAQRSSIVKALGTCVCWRPTHRVLVR